MGKTRSVCARVKYNLRSRIQAPAIVVSPSTITQQAKRLKVPVVKKTRPSLKSAPTAAAAKHTGISARKERRGQKRGHPEAAETSTHKRQKQDSTSGSPEIGSVSIEGELVYRSHMLDIRQIWEASFETAVRGIAWDEQERCWWIRTDGHGRKEVYQYSEHGERLLKIMDRLPNNNAGLAIDTKRERLLVGDWLNGLVIFSKDGRNHKRLSVKHKKPLGIFGVAYCPNKDRYILSDYVNHCLFFIDAAKGGKQKVVGKNGEGDYRFHDPIAVHHEMKEDGGCHVIVSDSCNDMIKIFTCDGKFVSKISSVDIPTCSTIESGALSNRSMDGPIGACTDQHGTLFVGDRGKKVVVLRDEGWNMITSTDDREPFCLSISDDGKYLASGTNAGDGLVTIYTIHRNY